MIIAPCRSRDDAAIAMLMPPLALTPRYAMFATFAAACHDAFY